MHYQASLSHLPQHAYLPHTAHLTPFLARRTAGNATDKYDHYQSQNIPSQGFFPPYLVFPTPIGISCTSLKGLKGLMDRWLQVLALFNGDAQQTDGLPPLSPWRVHDALV
jgi:hypothetical protein